MGWSETRDHPLRPYFWPVANTGDKLGKVADDDGRMTGLINTLKEKRVRRREPNISDQKPKGADQDIVIGRGNTLEVIDGLLKDCECRFSRQEWSEPLLDGGLPRNLRVFHCSYFKHIERRVLMA